MDRLLIETKFEANSDGEIEAIAWSFATPDRVGDVITKGAFASASFPIPLLFGHDPNDPVGVWSAGEEREDGLHLKGRLLVEDVHRAREVRALVRAGAVRGVSIGFRTKSASKRKGGGRTITDLELMECSLVTFPCHPGAQVASAKSAVRALQLATALHRAAAQLTRTE
ncbi:HK97 family phage prohead protease [uncultured Jannaschia sp.]|uniref:HK97 family phage prohead protease n=1 Tax=uncultured Jannaschia sp. TaxID=293347 RepID=UPI00261F9A50|nr:HK97 family phage prohead protease [uncultured Jannaschia sp.]